MNAWLVTSLWYTWTEKLNEWFIKRVPLEENEQADALAEVVAALPI